ncbi:immunity 50 family protein [Streptomyces sp. APSN-46.1]|uniref:immunity 50 family protein n=1 Tax=Streptomyces sp. APSN-46.1 TaxID=2929049 RepID=UPI001FB4670A|nr:immunity 50 family protein [Streptomyces sp. APSN-46.1]MCJ1678942.1 immunity 50 family protein [Streptomyces sp. APSN-46.1]
MTWSDFVVNAQAFATYYDEVPDLMGVRLRSVHLDGFDPTVTLRLDLPRFPDRWDGMPGDTMQCQIQFYMVQDFLMEGWQPPVTADITLRALPLHRLAVQVTAPGVAVSFTANASVKAGRISVFKLDPDGGDSGPHHFSRGLESKLYPTVPPTYVNTFYERV